MAVCLLLDYPICSRQQDVSGTAIYIENFSELLLLCHIKFAMIHRIRHDHPNYKHIMIFNTPDTANSPDCNTFATLGEYFNNEAGKNITCPFLLYPSGSVAEGSDPPTLSTGSCVHQPGSLPPNGSVSWCYSTPAAPLTGVGSGTLCINRTGHRTVSYSMGGIQQLKVHLDSITVLDDGRLSFPKVNFFFDKATIDNCTVFADDGRICGESNATIILLKRSKQQIASSNGHTLPIIYRRMVFNCMV